MKKSIQPGTLILNFVKYFSLIVASLIAVIPVVVCVLTAFKSNEEYANTSVLALPKSFGYLESFTRDWILEDNDKLSENGLLADKTMNTLLHILEAYTELYRVAPSEEVGMALKKILNAFSGKVYNKENHRLEVFFDAKMNTISDLYSYGHDIEASWLLDRACDVLNDKEISGKTKAYTTAIAGEVYKEALENGAMNNECFKGVVDTTRVWWVQAEAMVGFYNCYEKTGDEKYKAVTEMLWDYIKEHIIDKREGSEWFWDLNKDSEPESKKPIVEL